jgi:hypothetical protein
MILALLYISLVQVTASPEPTPEEVIVTGERLNRTRYNLSINRLTGAMRCRISRSSGDAIVDRAVCDIARHCARRAGLRREAIEACAEERRRQFVSTYVPRRM